MRDFRRDFRYLARRYWAQVQENRVNGKPKVTIYPDGSLYVDDEVVLRQYRKQLKMSPRSNLEEEEWKNSSSRKTC